MRDPFATRKIKTFVYADTCVVPRAQPVEIDGKVETMIDLRDAYGLSDDDIDGVTLTLRIPNRKGDQSAFAEIAQLLTTLTEDGPRLSNRIGSAGRDSFLHIVESWTFPGEPTATAYDNLEAWASEWVDSCVAAAWSEGRGLVDEKKDGTLSSPKRSRSSSAKEASPLPAA